VECYYCHKNSHYRSACKKRKADEKSEKSLSQEKEADSRDKPRDGDTPKLQYMAYHTSEAALAIESQNQWYFDSRATDYITRDRQAFSSFRDITPFPITLGDES